MIISGDATLYRSRDMLLMHVNRRKGTIAFSRMRKGKRANFGVLFEGISRELLLRPMVVCGPDTVVVFSFIDGMTFPARSTFSSSSFNKSWHDAPRQCTVCESVLSECGYGGEDDVVLCETCFKTWQYPRQLFYHIHNIRNDNNSSITNNINSVTNISGPLGTTRASSLSSSTTSSNNSGNNTATIMHSALQLDKSCYLVSHHIPRELHVNDYVEFE